MWSICYSWNNWWLMMMLVHIVWCNSWQHICFHCHCHCHCHCYIIVNISINFTSLVSLDTAVDKTYISLCYNTHIIWYDTQYILISCHLITSGRMAPILLALFIFSIMAYLQSQTERWSQYYRCTIFTIKASNSLKWYQCWNKHQEPRSYGYDNSKSSFG